MEEQADPRNHVESIKGALMADLYLNHEYTPFLNLRETERAIKWIKDTFEDRLADVLTLQRVSAPLFVRKGSGVNDDLNGVEHKVNFRVKDDNGTEAECLFSLAKWKRMVLADYGFAPGEGLYTDMNAIRPDEDNLDNLHSVYVDQWDWERVIRREERNLAFLKMIVGRIYGVIRRMEKDVCARYPAITPLLPEQITFVHSEELQARYPQLPPRERENAFVRECGAAFIIGIGAALADGNFHDNRAPDYDDWTAPTADGKQGLNGDIFVWYPVLDRALELSSMGIRVDPDALVRQLRIRGALNRLDFEWHKRLMNGELPLSIGGGIGQSRLCMYLLRKLHIGEVQASIWPHEIVARCRTAGVRLL
jgi:aspartate--ammonia ligase